MIPITCPDDGTALTARLDQRGRHSTYQCTFCHREWVISITDARHVGRFNTTATHASLVIDVDEALYGPLSRRHSTARIT